MISQLANGVYLGVGFALGSAVVALAQRWALAVFGDSEHS